MSYLNFPDMFFSCKQCKFSKFFQIESLDDKTQRIILKDVDFFAEGFYRCVATNEFGTASTKGEVALEGNFVKFFFATILDGTIIVQ